MSMTPADVLVVFGISRRPRQGHDVPVALPAGASRPAGLPDRGCRRRRLDGRRPPRPRPRRRSKATGERLDDEVFERFAARLSYVAGDFADAATYEGSRRRSGGTHPGLLPGDPAVPLRDGYQGARGGEPDQERTRGGGEAVRPRPGLRSGAGRGDPRVHRRGPALPDRPLPREDGAGGDPVPALRQHDVRARLESQLRLLGPDHDGRGLRRRGPRSLLRPRGRVRDVVVNHLMQVVAAAAMEAPSAGDATILKDASSRSTAQCARRTPRTTFAGSTRAIRTSPEWPKARRRRPTPPCAWRSTTGAGRACRSSSAPDKHLPVTQTELRLVFQHPPRMGFFPDAAHRPDPDQLVVKLDPTTGIRLLVEAQRGGGAPARGDQPRHGVRGRGR